MHLHSYVFTAVICAVFLGGVAQGEPLPDDLLGGPNLEEEEITNQDMTDRVLKEQGKSNKVGSRQQSRRWTTALRFIDLTKDQEVEIRQDHGRISKDESNI